MAMDFLVVVNTVRFTPPRTFAVPARDLEKTSGQRKQYPQSAHQSISVFVTREDAFPKHSECDTSKTTNTIPESVVMSDSVVPESNIHCTCHGWYYIYGI